MIFSADAIHRAQGAHRSLSVLLLLLRPDSDYNDDKELNSVVVTICNHCHRVLLFLLVASSALAGWPFERLTWAGTPKNRSSLHTARTQYLSIQTCFWPICTVSDRKIHNGYRHHRWPGTDPENCYSSFLRLNLNLNRDREASSSISSPQLRYISQCEYIARGWDSPNAEIIYYCHWISLPSPFSFIVVVVVLIESWVLTGTTTTTVVGGHIQRPRKFIS